MGSDSLWVPNKVQKPSCPRLSHLRLPLTLFCCFTCADGELRSLCAWLLDKLPCSAQTIHLPFWTPSSASSFSCTGSLALLTVNPSEGVSVVKPRCKQESHQTVAMLTSTGCASPWDVLCSFILLLLSTFLAGKVRPCWFMGLKERIRHSR